MAGLHFDVLELGSKQEENAEESEVEVVLIVDETGNEGDVGTKKSSPEQDAARSGGPATTPSMVKDRTQVESSVCPSDTWSCARCEEDPAPQHRATGPDRLARDELLRRFVAHDSCAAFLQTLPPYASEHGSPDSLQDMDAWVEKRLDIVVAERMNSKAKLDSLPYLADTLPYPLAVLCEAAAQANGMPFEFFVDTIVAACHSLLNKDFYAQLGQYRSKSRYWFVGTAEPGVGKSPAMEPVMKILFDVLREHAALLPGHAEDDWQYMQSSTTAAAVDKLLRSEGYLCLYTGEAGRCLDLAYAAGGKSDAVKTVNLSFFLDTTHGVGSTTNDEGESSSPRGSASSRRTVVPEPDERARDVVATGVVLGEVLVCFRETETHRIGAAVPLLVRCAAPPIRRLLEWFLPHGVCAHRQAALHLRRHNTWATVNKRQ